VKGFEGPAGVRWLAGIIDIKGRDRSVVVTRTAQCGFEARLANGGNSMSTDRMLGSPFGGPNREFVPDSVGM